MGTPLGAMSQSNNPHTALTKGSSDPAFVEEGLSQWHLGGSSKQGIIFALPVQNPSLALAIHSAVSLGYLLCNKFSIPGMNSQVNTPGPGSRVPNSETVTTLGAKETPGDMPVRQGRVRDWWTKELGSQ